ncbi:MAG: TonB-dependent receptor [Maricaulaceae bacterium]
MKNFRKNTLISSSFKALLLAGLCGSVAPSAAAQVDDEVIVTGSLIKRAAQADRSSPVTTFDAADIDSVGAKSIADLTQTLTINTGAENNPDAFTQSGTTGTSNINLRGLGVQSTLVLLNGRRQVLSGAVTNGGFNFVDTSSLVPLIAVDNLEILKDGASAIYGSDAVAGVANFSTHDDFDGLRLSAQYQTVAGEGSSDEILLQALVGKNFDRGNILGAVSYTDRTPLTTAERRLSRPQDDTSALGNPGAFVPIGSVLTGGPLDSLPLIDPGCEAAGGIAQVGVPGAAVGLPLDVGTCGFDFGEFFNLVAEEERLNAYVQADFELTDTISWRGEFSYADNEAVRGNSPTFPFLQNGFIPATNPNFLPELAAIGSVGAVFLGRASGNGGEVSPNETTSETWRFSTELAGEFGSTGADWRVSYTQAENTHEVLTEDTLVSEFSCALAGACEAIGGPAGFFNPFSTSFTTAPNSPEILDFITGVFVRDTTSELQVIDAVVTTPIGESDAAIAFGVQYRSEDFSGEFDENAQADNFGFLIGEQNYEGNQDVFALFSEVVVPFSDQFELQAALRYEDYGSGVGDTLDPKVAFLFRPADYLSLRGSFSTSFRAPSVSQQFSQQTILGQIADPLTGGSVFAAARTFGPESEGGIASGAEALSPEQSEAFNFGVSFEPVKNLEFDVDIYSFDFSDVITAENAQAVVNADPSNAARVERNIAGAITQVNTNFVNAGSVETSGVDFGVKYSWDTDFGTIVPFVQGTWVFNYDLEDPQAGNVDGLGSRNFTNFGTSVPQLRFNTGFNWSKDAHRLDVFGRFIDSYEDDQNANATIDSHFTVDARYALNLGEILQNNFVSDTALTVGVINAFDEDPPQVFTNGGFDSKVHDPRGRLLYVGVDVTF